MTGGLFVALAYFGTDQSQVQRYLGGASLTESRLGLLFHGLFKLPMQFLILSVGVLLFVFYQFNQPPVFFDEARWAALHRGSCSQQAQAIDGQWSAAGEARRARAVALVKALDEGSAPAITRSREELKSAVAGAEQIRAHAKELLVTANPRADTQDADYIFIGFVVAHFPAGLVGLLLAVILCAAMSAVAAALNSLGTTTRGRLLSPRPEVRFHRLSTRCARPAGSPSAGAWSRSSSPPSPPHLDNLIQAVNILGSIFYGPMLGVFLTGFFLPWVRATPAFLAVLAAQALVVAVWLASPIGFLWYNVIGCAAVVAIALGAEALTPRDARDPALRR